MNIIINGEKKIFSETPSVASIINEYNLPQKGVVAELNHTIIQTDQWNTTRLKENDQLELISFVGGG